MTSLEALAEVKCSLDNLIENDYKVEEINIIEKELKAFEILKTKLLFNFNNKVIYINDKKHTFYGEIFIDLNLDERRLLMEVLENE